MSDVLAGKALTPLHELVDAAGFPLSALIDAQQYAAIFDRFYVADADAYLEDDTLHADLELLYEGVLALPLPGLDGFQLVFNSSMPGWTRLRASLALGGDPACMIHGASIALEVPPSLLQDVASGGRARITLTTDVLISGAGLSFVNVGGATLPPARLLDTDLVVQATGLLPIVELDEDDDALPAIRGVEFSLLSVQVPLAFLSLADQGVFTCEISGARIDATGFTGAVLVEAAELPATVAGRYLALPFELRRFGLDVEQNRINAFFIAIAVRLPAVQEAGATSWLALTLNLDRNNQTVTATLEAPLMLTLGRPDFTVTLEALALSGQHGDDGFSVQGTASGTLALPGTVVTLAHAGIDLVHASAQTRLGIQVDGLVLGALGTVDTARLVIVIANDAAADTSTLESVTLETTLRWQDLRGRVPLGDLPPGFPLPPDDATISVALDWHEDGKVEMRLAAALADIDALWGFMPPAFRPETRNVRFSLVLLYESGADFDQASTGDSLVGDLSVEVELRVPALPAVPGASLFKLQGEPWIAASLKGGIRSVDGSDESYMEMTVAGAPVVTVDFPGLPQAEPPIEIEITQVAFDLALSSAADSLDGHLRLDGDFVLRPIHPAQSSLPVPPAMSTHVEKLFKAVGLGDVAGTATVDLRFKGDQAAVDVSLRFDEARIELDLFDMLAGLTRGMAAPPEMDGSASRIDLDIEVDIRLREITVHLGSIEENAATAQSRFGFALALDGTVAGVQVDDFSFALSDQELSFGFGHLAVPVALPHFPVGRADLDPLRDSSGAWDHANLWQQGARPQLVSAIAQVKDEIEALRDAGGGAASGGAALRAKRQALFELTAKQFLIDSIFAVHQLVGASNRRTYQAFVEAYMALMDATLHQFAFDTTLDFVLRDVRFVLPFHDPTNIRVEGGAQLTGFKPDDPLAPLGSLVFTLGLSTEYIYFSVEGGEPIPLPLLGTSETGEANVSVTLDHARIGYGYSKNALMVAFAGELRIAPALANQLDTSGTLGIGVRLPGHSRLGFKLDLIPIVLGEVDFLLPLFQFDLDLRSPNAPGIADSAGCVPFWDGFQINAPNVVRQDLKRLRFAPFFGSLLAPNYTTSFDVMLGDARHGLTHVCNEYLVIVPVSASTTIPMIADGVPFFDDLCTSVRLAGFGVSFDLQRPFPSMSPLALFEIFGLLADPMMPIDPDGALAGTMRATIQNARITLPPAVVRMFPEHGPVLTREVNYTVNLATVIAIGQGIAGSVGKVLEQAQAAGAQIGALLQQVASEPPALSPAALLALLPPELRRFELHGSFVGFDASAVFLLLTPAEAASAFAGRESPAPERPPRLVVDERFAEATLPGWEVSPPKTRESWRVEGGALHRDGRGAPASHAIYRHAYRDVSVSVGVTVESEQAVGLVFGYADAKNHYRFEMNPAAGIWRVVKVREGRTRVLQTLTRRTRSRRRHAVTVTSVGRASLPSRGRIDTAVRLVVEVDGRVALDVLDSSAVFTAGRLGVTCAAGASARFDRLRIHRLGAPQPPRPGESPDPAWFTSFQPSFSRPGIPLHDPTDTTSALLASPPFDAFDGASLAALPTPPADASGVLVGAEVKLLDDQRFALLGYVFTDGTFGLVSALGVTPLRLAVAGIPVELPLEVHGRLTLEGRAHGARSHARVRAQVWGAWEPVPGVVELTAGSTQAPVELTLSSNGHFALRGSGTVSLFGGAASVSGSVDITQAHCLVSGTFHYEPDVMLGDQRLIDLSLTTSGRIGPAGAFALGGAGTLAILGKSFSQVRGSVSDRGVEVQAQLDSGAFTWNGIAIRQCRLALTGSVDLQGPGAPRFRLEGEGRVRLFGSATSKARAEISGRAGIRAEAGDVTQFVEGLLYWQGREWIGGRIELGAGRIDVRGRTAFALDLTPAQLPTGLQLAGLFFRVDLAGGFRLTATGGLEACDLEVDWALAVRMPGIEQQYPIAMQKKRFSYSGGTNAPSGTIDLLPLLDIDSALFLPRDTLALPIPVVSADQYTQYYWYWDAVAQPGHVTYRRVSVTDTGTTSDPRFPTGVSKTGDLDIAAAIAVAFNLPPPPVPINVPTYGVSGWKYITFTDAEADLPAIRAPRVSASVPSSVPANEKFALFSLPTHFAASFQDGASMLRGLKFSLALAWQDGKLGLRVSRNGSTRFTAFQTMFD